MFCMENGLQELKYCERQLLSEIPEVGKTAIFTQQGNNMISKGECLKDMQMARDVVTHQREIGLQKK